MLKTQDAAFINDLLDAGAHLIAPLHSQIKGWLIQEGGAGSGGTVHRIHASYAKSLAKRLHQVPGHTRIAVYSKFKEQGKP